MYQPFSDGIVSWFFVSWYPPARWCPPISALREAAVKLKASNQVFSLDDVRKVVRQELFCAHRGRGRRGNGSERRRAGKKVHWMAEKKRRWRQASDAERVRRRDSMLVRLAEQFVVLNISVAFGAWRQFARVRQGSIHHCNQVK